MNVVARSLKVAAQFLAAILQIKLLATYWSGCGNLIVPRKRRQIGDRAFSVAAPQAWNRLVTELKRLRSTDLFRSDLKTFLFHSLFGHQDKD